MDVKLTCRASITVAVGAYAGKSCDFSRYFAAISIKLTSKMLQLIASIVGIVKRILEMLPVVFLLAFKLDVASPASRLLMWPYL